MKKMTQAQTYTSDKKSTILVHLAWDSSNTTYSLFYVISNILCCVDRVIFWQSLLLLQNFTTDSL